MAIFIRRVGEVTKGLVGGGALNPSSESFFYDDFDYENIDDFWSKTVANGGIVIVNASKIDATHVGILMFEIISSESSRAGIRLSTSKNGLKTGGGVVTFETLLQIETLATAVEDFTATFGTGDRGNANIRDHDDGIYFKYNRSVSPNWIVKTARNAIETGTTTSVAVVAGNWFKLKYVVNATATSVDFFINGVLVATHTTNIPQPTLASDPPDDVITQIYKVKKSAGTASRRFFIDYHLNSIEFTNPR